MTNWWLRTDKETGTDSTVDEATVRQRIAGHVKDVDLAIKGAYEEGDIINTPFAYYGAAPKDHYPGKPTGRNACQDDSLFF